VHWQTYCYWATSLARIGRHHEAIAKFEEAVKLVDAESVDKGGLARCYDEWADALEAISRFGEAAEKRQMANSLRTSQTAKKRN
jgi:tetratricopeptide (TPR) repeat protein